MRSASLRATQATRAPGSTAPGRTLRGKRRTRSPGRTRPSSSRAMRSMTAGSSCSSEIARDRRSFSASSVRTSRTSVSTSPRSRRRARTPLSPKIAITAKTSSAPTTIHPGRVSRVMIRPSAPAAASGGPGSGESQAPWGTPRHRRARAAGSGVHWPKTAISAMVSNAPTTIHPRPVSRVMIRPSAPAAASGGPGERREPSSVRHTTSSPRPRRRIRSPLAEDGHHRHGEQHRDDIHPRRVSRVMVRRLPPGYGTRGA